MRRLIWLPLAGALLISGAAVATAAPDLIDDMTASVASVPARAGGLLAEVLADLVDQDVITQQQSDAITDELDTRFEEKRAEMETRRAEMRAVAQQVRGFLEDGVITADEVAQLPEGELKSALEGLLQDGDITIERLHDLGAPFFHRGRHGPGGPGSFEGGPRWEIPSDDQGS